MTEYSYVLRQEIARRVTTLVETDKKHADSIFKIMKKLTSEYSESPSGVFFMFDKLGDDVVDAVNDYLESVDSNGRQKIKYEPYNNQNSDASKQTK